MNWESDTEKRIWMCKRRGDESDGIEWFKMRKLEEEEMTKKSLCLCFESDTKYRWYNLDFDNGYSLLSEFNIGDLPGFHSTVLYDSKLYFIGGLNRVGNRVFASPEAFFINLSNAPNKISLQEAPLMIAGKFSPVVAAIDSKIYVLGTSACMTDITIDTSYIKPWAEVFDIVSNTWSDLPFPSEKAIEQSKYKASYVYHEKTKRIITSYPDSNYSGDLWYFDITTCSWGFIPQMHNLLSALKYVHGRPVIVDDDLYIIYRHKLCVASVVKPGDLIPVHGLKKAIKSLETKFDDDDISSFLSHLGNGLLCLVWCVHKRRKIADVHCLKFRVNKIPSYFNAVIESDDSFIFDGVDYLRDCLPFVMHNTTAPAVDPVSRCQITSRRRHSSRQSTRHARRVLVDGLPPKTDTHTIATFFADNIVLEPGHNDTGPVVLDVYINKERNFAIVELSSEEQANSAMVLSNPRLNGVPLTICRPADYKQPQLKKEGTKYAAKSASLPV
ncbi:Splicing factor u2af large subunit a [Thalictrum thalictroides]|uniref:Splicing factor u2af large subunit a n=1 Tax=Thalictrum thalictroides TaxID=46969 RepID=A0A7J6UU45_THATH|nr:Splicing factor u2af large subunit a [Thalictrum thalictroides]